MSENPFLAPTPVAPVAPVSDKPAPVANFPAYTPKALVELLVAHPTLTPTAAAAYFGRNFGWLSGILASDTFQAAIAPHRHEILDPFYTATMDERFRALSLQALVVISHKLEGSDVSEFLAVKAAELATKALGMGQAKTLTITAAVVAGPDAVADRILQAMEKAKARVASGPIVDVVAKTHAPDPDETPVELIPTKGNHENH